MLAVRLGMPVEPVPSLAKMADRVHGHHGAEVLVVGHLIAAPLSDNSKTSTSNSNNENNSSSGSSSSSRSSSSSNNDRPDTSCRRMCACCAAP